MQVVISLENTDDGTLVRVAGDLDAATRPHWEAALSAAAAADPHAVVVDMSRVTFCDAAGLAPLVGLHSELRGSGRRLVLRSPSRQVRRLLDLTRLAPVMADGDAGPSSGPSPRSARRSARRSALADSFAGWMSSAPARTGPASGALSPSPEP